MCIMLHLMNVFSNERYIRSIHDDEKEGRLQRAFLSSTLRHYSRKNLT